MSRHHQLDMNVSVKLTCESKRWLDSSLLALLCLTWIDHFSRLRRQRCRYDSRRRWKSLFCSYKQDGMDLLLASLFLDLFSSSVVLRRSRSYLIDRRVRRRSHRQWWHCYYRSILWLHYFHFELLVENDYLEWENRLSSSNKKITSQANEQKQNGNQIARAQQTERAREW